MNRQQLSIVKSLVLALVATIHIGSVSADPQCSPGATGLFSHPEDCNKFMNCWQGVTHIQNCGAGTVFNPANQQCDWPSSMNCVNGRPAGGSAAQQAPKAPPVFQNTYIQPVQQSPQYRPAPPPSQSNSASCPDGYWLCQNNADCIKTEYYCDGTMDCPDNSDERNCRGK